MSPRPEGPKEWGPETGPLPRGSRLREMHDLVERAGWPDMPGRRWVVCWSDQIPLTDEEKAGERPAFEHVLNKVGVENEADTNPDLGYAAYVDHSYYFQDGEEAEALEFFMKVRETARDATLAMSILDTEW